MTTALPHGHRPTLWQVRDLQRLFLLLVGGLSLIIFGWFGASGELELKSQVRWVNIGVTGVIVEGIGAVFWLLAARRAVGQLRRQLTPGLRAAGARASAHVPASPISEPEAGTFFAALRMTRYHREHCLLVAGKDAQATTETEHRANGREPCGVCLPGRPEPDGRSAETDARDSQR